MSIKRNTFNYMNKYIHTNKKLSPQKIFALRHKTAVKEKLLKFVRITSIVLIFIGLSTITLISVFEKQTVKDCIIEKETLANYPLKQPNELLIKHCIERDLW